MKGENVKRIFLIFVLVAFVFSVQGFAYEEQVLERANVSYPSTQDDDLNPVYSPLVHQIIEARNYGDTDLYRDLIEEWKKTTPVQPNDAPPAFVEWAQDHPYRPQMRWGNDITIYSGNVTYNSWAMTSNIDDESIDVCCHIGDTLIAAVACSDSIVRLFKSYDLGLNWNYIVGCYVPGTEAYEPEVIYTLDGDYHLFFRTSNNLGSIICFNFDDQGNWTAPWITTEADTISNYTVTSDRADYPSYYYFYLMYHKQLGGAGSDQCWFTRSLDQGESWETPTALQGAGSEWPDLVYGSYGYLFQTRLWFQTSGDITIRSRTSADYGNSWGGSQTVFGDTTRKMGPQIAASHDGQNHLWVVCPRFEPGVDYGNIWSRSTDQGGSWGGVGYINSAAGYQEVLPDIEIHDGTYDSLYYPYVTFIRSADDWTSPYVSSFFWCSGDTWSHPDSSHNDYVPEFTRPIQTWQGGGVPAMAYVGENGVNVYFDGWAVGVDEEEGTVSKKTIIKNAKPNPFTSMTRVEYTLPHSGLVTVKAYNVLGQEVATIFNGMKESGNHTVNWYGVDNSGNKLPKGIYFLKVNTPDISSTKKLILQ
jgi:hypothetical protein